MRKKLLIGMCIVLALCLGAACVGRFVTFTAKGYTLGEETYRLPVIRYGQPKKTAIIEPWDSVAVKLTEEELADLLGGWADAEEHLGWNDFRLEGTVRVYLKSGYEINPESWCLQISGSRKGDLKGEERFSLYLSPGEMPPGKLGEHTNGVSNHLWNVEADACRWMWDEPLEKLQLRFLTEDVGVHFEAVSADRDGAEELAARLARYVVEDRGLSLEGFQLPQEKIEQAHQEQWGHMISTRD